MLSMRISFFLLPLNGSERVDYFPEKREILIVHTKIIEPLYEAKSDQWIANELMKKLGIDPKKSILLVKSSNSLIN